MIDVAELRAVATANTSPFNAIEVQSIGGGSIRYQPFIRYTSSTTIQVGATAVGLNRDTDGYLDEVWGVES